MQYKANIIRHGTTNYNGDGLLRGFKDVPLSDKGLNECKDTARKCKQLKLTGLIHSPLTRAKQTAEVINKETGIPIIGEDKGLMPWDVGDYTGKSVKDSLPILQRYMNELANVAIPGGESFNTFKQRYLTALMRIGAKYKDQNVGIVAHHRNERTVKAWSSKGCSKDLAIDPMVMNQEGEPPASVSQVDIEIPEDTNDNDGTAGVVPALVKLLGTYKAYEWNQQMIHWQNRGKTNDIIHKRCDESYKYAQVAIDELAERLVMGLGGAIPLIMCDVMGQSTIQFMSTLPDCENVAQYLVDLDQELINQLKLCKKEADSSDDSHTDDMIGDFIDRHQTHQGFIKMLIPKVLPITTIPDGTMDPKGNS